MKRPRRKFLDPAVGALALLVLSFGLVNHGALSQAGRTIKLVVPLPPAGGADILARILAEQIARAQGLTVVVENRPGAGTAIGTESVARAAPNGNTLLFNTANIVIGPHLRKVNYDPLTSFEPVCYLANASPCPGQQRVVLSHADGTFGRSAGKTGRIDACECRPRNHVARRIREAHAIRRRKDDLCPLFRHGPRGNGIIGPACDSDDCRTSCRSRARKSRQAACAGHRLQVTDRIFG